MKYNININFLSYNSIITSIKCFYSKFNTESSPKKYNTQPHFDLLMKTKKGASPIYQKIIKTEKGITGLQKWSNTLGISEEKWTKSFYILTKLTKDTKLRWLQFRVLHHILSTNRSVSKFINEQNDMCSFCQAHSETILHLLWECKEIQSFWKDLADLLNRRCANSHNLSFNEHLIIFGESDVIHTDKICKLIILTAKLYIYKCKVQRSKVKINIFVKELYNYYSVQKQVQKKLK